MSYVKFATAASWVDLSPYISVPVDDIINEIKFVENMFNDNALQAF